MKGARMAVSPRDPAPFFRGGPGKLQNRQPSARSKRRKRERRDRKKPTTAVAEFVPHPGLELCCCDGKHRIVHSYNPANSECFMNDGLLVAWPHCAEPARDDGMCHTVQCPHCLDYFTYEDQAEGDVIFTDEGIVCAMCQKAGREPR